MIGIVDYGAGNLASVWNAFENLGFDAEICNDASRANEFERLLLPGVGSFRAATESLYATGWAQAIKDFAAIGRPLMGICLGMQLLLEYGEEHGPSSGLGLIKGKVIPFELDAPFKVPHVGWNNLSRIGSHPVLSGIKPHVDFYFVHSFQCVTTNPDNTIATCDYGGDFAAIVGNANVIGTQFHPEKSQPMGLRILENFAEWEPEC